MKNTHDTGKNGKAEKAGKVGRIPPQELIERYVYAVVKNIPAKKRGDLDGEIRMLITDMIEERRRAAGQSGSESPSAGASSADTPYTNAEVRAVLIELGTPAETAARYIPHKQTYLIGAPWYDTYRLILKIVLPAVAFGLLVAKTFELFTGTTTPWYILPFEIVGTIVMALISAFGMVTLIFAALQRSSLVPDSAMDADDLLDLLPSVPAKEERIGRGESIAGMVFGLIFTIIFLAVPEIFAAFDGTGYRVTIFNPDIIRSFWYVIAIWTVCEIVRDSIRLYDGRYTLRVGISSVPLNIIAAVCAVFLFGDGRLFNPEFYQFMAGLFTGTPFLVSFFNNLHKFLLGIILLALAGDLMSVWIRVIRYTGFPERTRAD